jgi:hypothetical protein
MMHTPWSDAGPATTWLVMYLQTNTDAASLAPTTALLACSCHWHWHWHSMRRALAAWASTAPQPSISLTCGFFGSAFVALASSLTAFR